jgi:hypothetical protein
MNICARGLASSGNYDRKRAVKIVPNCFPTGLMERSVVRAEKVPATNPAVGLDDRLGNIQPVG